MQWEQKLKEYKRKVGEVGIFPADYYKISCLIYSKGNYGIFLLKDWTGKFAVVKVIYFYDNMVESSLGLYIKDKAGNVPNLLHPEQIYKGDNPKRYRVFQNLNLQNNVCKKDADIKKIFIQDDLYAYYVTQLCAFNLQAYLGREKKKLTYYQFVAFTFELLIALQTLYKIGVFHRDVKAANVLICDTDLEDTSVVYQTDKGLRRVIDYEKSEYKYIKLADFGESILQDSITPCMDFNNEIKIALVGTIDYMWRNTLNQENPELYQLLVENLKGCQTDLYDIIERSNIFDILVGQNKNNENAKIVNLL